MPSIESQISRNILQWMGGELILILCFFLPTNIALAQEVDNFAVNDNKTLTPHSSPILTERESMLLERIEKLEKRLQEVEAQLQEQRSHPLDSFGTASVSSTKMADTVKQSAPQATSLTNTEKDLLNFFQDTTFNLTLDGYYGYNFNRPVGRANLLRAYDIQSNSFSLNQATFIIERAPNLEVGRRFGVRLDLQYGQATETLQGNGSNELRPQAYRPILQAYGTYILPMGKGVTVNFGKFTSSLGIENNYTKDQINYSRSYFFNFLPFYHLGFQSSYTINDKISVTHWLVNGVQQSEDFNGFKSQALIVNVKPIKDLSFNINYYTGIEGRDANPHLNPTLPTLPTQPGIPNNQISPAPRGRLHILDSYLSWQVSEKLLVAGEADYVINRTQTFSSPARVTGGALYLRYQLTPKFALATRGEYLSDRGGLFSGISQALKENTFTAEYKPAEGFLLRAEYRRDFSNQPFFLTNRDGLLKKEQNTATLGLVWWLGRKTGNW